MSYRCQWCGCPVTGEPNRFRDQEGIPVGWISVTIAPQDGRETHALVCPGHGLIAAILGSSDGVPS